MSGYRLHFNKNTTIRAKKESNKRFLKAYIKSLPALIKVEKMFGTNDGFVKMFNRGKDNGI